MAQDTQRELLPSDNVARYCSPRHLGGDGLPLEAAFHLRDSENYVSTNWLEHFHPADRPFQLDCLRQSLKRKLNIGRNARLAVLNVETAVVACKSKLSLDIRFITLDDPDDPSHTGIYGMAALTAEDKASAATALAKSVKPDAVYPAT